MAQDATSQRPVTSIPVKIPLAPFIDTPDVRARVLVAIASHGRGDHACIARTPYLAALLAVEPATVRQAITDLHRDGYITAHGDGWKARDVRPGEHWVKIRPDAVERAATSGKRTATRDVQVYALALYLASTRPGPVRQATVRALAGIADKRTVNAALARLETAGLVQATRAVAGAATDYRIFQAPTSGLTSADLPSTAGTSEVRTTSAHRYISGAPTGASEVRGTGASEVRHSASIGSTRAGGAATYDTTGRRAPADPTPQPPTRPTVPIGNLVDRGWMPADPLPARHQHTPAPAPAAPRPELDGLRARLADARTTYRNATGRYQRGL